MRRNTKANEKIKSWYQGIENVHEAKWNVKFLQHDFNKYKNSRNDDDDGVFTDL